ncbi:hypothetical protein ASPVEDRAFT_119655 [Aspergillus versicolor CBS 583.65]|uniref:DUF2293 domain-containing protein n=1 Tax=Aspergillus versicolor CBS 583.65 TaxID=1036611 RepID=A0A1L9P6T4_ASPVE|nr:uncharacterized protein ASPVEDRAFT_119655 [Aspergillus versicolor CBS 583.65]OJI97196.1 hypothetical protein ASPVEDRAFT_119655 [Aspergillus versicolor CBS 583.65]
MAPTTRNRKPARRKARKIQHRPRRKNRVEKRSAPSSPQLKIAKSRPRTLSKQALFKKSELTAVNHKPKAAESKGSPRMVKYQLATQWPSSEPFEKNCLQRDPLPADYVFVPRGDVYVTRNCRSKTKESQRLVYKVYDNTGKRSQGIRVPADVYTTVLQSAQETAESRAGAVKLRDQKDLAQSRELLCKQFPLMPVGSLDVILHHAFLKGSGRVGRTTTTSDERKAILAVEAHIRHMHTPYEILLRQGKSRDDARKEVWEMVQAIRMAWAGQGHGVQPALLPVRSRTNSAE